jgi:cephalosporin hydroxylase
MNLDVLTARYNLLKEKNTDIGHFMDDLAIAVKETRALTVIELGTRYGASTIAFLHALYDQGKLWSVDCSFPVKDPETGEELLSSQGPLGCVDYWCFLLGYDTSPMVLDALPDLCDILFIDTNHVYEETLDELELYINRICQGGRIILHDTFIETTGNDPHPEAPIKWPVRRAVEEFCTKYALRYEFKDIYPGLGTIYV